MSSDLEFKNLKELPSVLRDAENAGYTKFVLEVGSNIDPHPFEVAEDKSIFVVVIGLESKEDIIQGLTRVIGVFSEPTDLIKELSLDDLFRLAGKRARETLENIKEAPVNVVYIKDRVEESTLNEIAGLSNIFDEIYAINVISAGASFSGEHLLNKAYKKTLHSFITACHKLLKTGGTLYINPVEGEKGGLLRDVLNHLNFQLEDFEGIWTIGGAVECMKRVRFSQPKKKYDEREWNDWIKGLKAIKNE